MGKMRIIFYTPKINKIGGSIRTLLSYMDTIKELGWDVKMWTRVNEKLSHFRDLQSQLYFNGYKNINGYDFIINGPLPNEEKDVMFFRGNVQPSFSDRKSINWCISDGDVKDHPSIIERWTNSNTTASKYELDMNVVIPPHDYSLFRAHGGNPQANRRIEFVHIARINGAKEKGIDVFVDTVHRLKKARQSLLIAICNMNDQASVKYLRSLDIPIVINQDRKQMASILNNSKYLLFPSRIESCSLSIYEAMNAGCVPIVRSVGAAREQMGDLGYTFQDDKHIAYAIRKAWADTQDLQEYMAQGELFDKKNNIITLKDRLINIENNL
jgi:glycosyltransferase involved in cell wall biosynthesis